MEVRFERCCGSDVHKKGWWSVCLQIVKNLEILHNDGLYFKPTPWLIENHCDVVAMENAVVYWNLIYNFPDERSIKQIVGNAQHMKVVPDRKADLKDAEWIADLVRHSLIQASYIPRRE